MAKAEGKPEGDDWHALSQRSLLFRAIHALVKGGGNRTAALEVVRKHALDPEEALIIKASTAAATTSNAPWAGELLAPALREFMIAPRLLINPAAIAAAAALSNSSNFALIQALAAGTIGDRVKVITSGNLALDTIALIDAGGCWWRVVMGSNSM